MPRAVATQQLNTQCRSYPTRLHRLHTHRHAVESGGSSTARTGGRLLAPRGTDYCTRTLCLTGTLKKKKVRKEKAHTHSHTPTQKKQGIADLPHFSFQRMIPLMTNFSATRKNTTLPVRQRLKLLNVPQLSLYRCQRCLIKNIAPATTHNLLRQFHGVVQLRSVWKLPNGKEIRLKDAHGTVSEPILKALSAVRLFSLCRRQIDTMYTVTG